MYTNHNDSILSFNNPQIRVFKISSAIPNEEQKKSPVTQKIPKITWGKQNPSRKTNESPSIDAIFADYECQSQNMLQWGNNHSAPPDILPEQIPKQSSHPDHVIGEQLHDTRLRKSQNIGIDHNPKTRQISPLEFEIGKFRPSEPQALTKNENPQTTKREWNFGRVQPIPTKIPERHIPKQTFWGNENTRNTSLTRNLDKTTPRGPEFIFGQKTQSPLISEHSKEKAAISNPQKPILYESQVDWAPRNSVRNI